MSLHKPLLRKLIFICLGMFAFSFALIPLYTVLCKLTGINGKVALTPAQAATSTEIKRDIKVEFLAQTDKSIPWTFTSEVAHISVHPGEIKEINFRVENLANEAVVAQAIPSVSPGQAAEYLKKMECFCFNKQPLNARESKLMRLQFYVDPELPKNVQTITLSYTLYKITN